MGVHALDRNAPRKPRSPVLTAVIGAASVALVVIRLLEAVARSSGGGAATMRSSPRRSRNTPTNCSIKAAGYFDSARSAIKSGVRLLDLEESWNSAGPNRLLNGRRTRRARGNKSVTEESGSDKCHQ
jgi:hypothetical protein